MGKDIPHLFIPEGGADLAVDPFVSKEGDLPVFEGDIDEHTIAGSGLFHVEAGEDLGGPVDGIHIAAAALDVYPDLAAGAVFGGLDRCYDLLLLLFIKQRFACKEGHLFYIELDIGGILAARVRLVVRFLVEVEDPGEDVIGESSHLEIIVVDRGVEVPAGHVDPVLRAFDLGLKVLELLSCLEVGIGLGDGHEAAERSGQLCLGALILPEGSGVVNIDMDGRGICARLNYGRQGRLFKVGGAFDDLDDATIQVSPTLILRFDVTPRVLYALVGGDHAVVPAAGAAAKQENDGQDDDKG